MSEHNSRAPSRSGERFTLGNPPRREPEITLSILANEIANLRSQVSDLLRLRDQDRNVLSEVHAQILILLQRVPDRKKKGTRRDPATGRYTSDTAPRAEEEGDSRDGSSADEEMGNATQKPTYGRRSFSLRDTKPEVEVPERSSSFPQNTSTPAPAAKKPKFKIPESYDGKLKGKTARQWWVRIIVYMMNAGTTSKASASA